MDNVVPCPENATRIRRHLYFLDLLEDCNPTKLSWTKIGVMLSTVFTTVTGFVATTQTVVGDVAHSDWQLFAATIGLHSVTKSAHEIKRFTEKK